MEVSVERMKEIFGEAREAANVTAGEVFEGAFRAANAAGYSSGSDEFEFFVSAYLQALPAEIMVNADNRILGVK